MKQLNVGLIGYGFMGRTHSSAFRKVNNFFDLPYQPMLKAVCARDVSNVTKKFKHSCWDGCLFPSDVMMKQETRNNILAAMIQVREAYGWME